MLVKRRNVLCMLRLIHVLIDTFFCAVCRPAVTEQVVYIGNARKKEAYVVQSQLLTLQVVYA